MITILFFAKVREMMGVDKLEWPEANISIETLQQKLSEKEKKWAIALESGYLVHTINHTVVTKDHLIQDGDEVAFFPPVTGG